MTGVHITVPLNLCTFSKSEILKQHVLAECPLELTQSQAKCCACRKRLYDVPPADLRVLSCTYPKLWNGKRIKSFDALKESIVRKSKAKDGGKESPLKARMKAWRKQLR